MVYPRIVQTSLHVITVRGQPHIAEE